jgi:hypothetical protein
VEKVLDTFFNLVRAGLFLEPANVTQEVDWEAVYTLSVQQSMLGVVLDGIRLLPKEYQPPAPLLMKWMGVVAKLEAQNDLLNQRVVELMELYRSENIPAVLLKGQGVALNYPNPRHRMCGDIDVYVGEKNYKRANTLLLKEKAKLFGGLNYKHTTFDWRNVFVENHRVMLSFGHKYRNMRYQKRINAWFPRDVKWETFYDAKIALPPSVFDVIYLLHHAMFHLYIDGLGMRQPMDWLLFLKEHKDELDKEQLENDLKDYDLFRFAQAVAYIGVNYLGFTSSQLLIDLPEDKKWGELLLNELLKSGNFGQYDRRKSERPKGFLQSKWYTFYQSQRRIFRLYQLAPKESWGITIYSLRGKLYNLLHFKRTE